MYVNNWNDYCTCNRCPCCGKIVRPQLRASWGTASPSTTTMNCTSLSESDLQKIREGIKNASHTIS